MRGKPHRVHCFVCGKRFELHPDLPVPLHPLCITHRKRKLTAEQRTLPLFVDEQNESQLDDAYREQVRNLRAALGQQG